MTEYPFSYAVFHGIHEFFAAPPNPLQVPVLLSPLLAVIALYATLGTIDRIREFMDRRKLTRRD